MAVKKTSKKKVKKNVPLAYCFVKAGFGNTTITMTDPAGNTLCWSSAGSIGFKGSRRGTPFAAQMTAENVAKKASELGVSSVNIFLKGPGAGRDPSIRAMANAGLKILSMRDMTPIPHNGCRPPKRRRI